MGHGDIAENKTRISLVIPKELKGYFMTIAEAEDRSLNYVIVKALQSYRDGDTGHKQQAVTNVTP